MLQSPIFAIQTAMPLAIQTGLFTSFCTIQQPAVTSDGEPAVDAPGTPPGTYSDIAGLTGIRCMDSPENFGSGIIATEVKALSEVASIEVRHVLLAGYFAALDTRTNWGNIGWRAEITNQFGVVTIYDLLGAEPDSQRTMIRLKVRQVSL